MLTALSFTHLQMLAMKPSDDNQQLKAQLIEQLKGHKQLEGMNNYGETDAVIDTYIQKIDN